MFNSPGTPEARLTSIEFRPIGHIESCFQEKFATPRQGSLAPSSRARLCLHPEVVGSGALDGLEAFSHLWLIWVFDQNASRSSEEPISPKIPSTILSSSLRSAKGKICPPRGGGKKLGVLASRSPHRPNPIGLSLVKIENIDTASLTLELSGIDLVDGTAVLDIKPYIEDYDRLEDYAHLEDYVHPASPHPGLAPAAAPLFSRPPSLDFLDQQTLFPVHFDPQVIAQLKKWEDQGQLPQSKDILIQTLKESLQQDPRPLPYRKSLSITGKSKDHFAARIYNLNWRFRYFRYCDQLKSPDLTADRSETPSLIEVFAVEQIEPEIQPK